MNKRKETANFCEFRDDAERIDSDADQLDEVAVRELILHEQFIAIVPKHGREVGVASGRVEDFDRHINAFGFCK